MLPSQAAAAITHFHLSDRTCVRFTAGFSNPKLCSGSLPAAAPLPSPSIKPLSLHFESVCMCVEWWRVSALFGWVRGQKTPHASGFQRSPSTRTHIQNPASVTHSGLNPTKGRITVTLLPWWGRGNPLHNGGHQRASNYPPARPLFPASSFWTGSVRLRASGAQRVKKSRADRRR